MVKLTLTVFLILISFTTHAEIYKWYDEAGNLHFSDQKPKHLQSETVEIKPNIEGYKTTYENMPEVATEQKVVMYMTDWCGYCKKARKYFIKNKIPFTERNIEKSASAKREHKALGGGGIPVITLNGAKMRGFSPQRFDSFYSNALKP